MLKEFIKKTSTENNMFPLHIDIMRHCIKIVAIVVAERLGRKDGYNLLLAGVKSSLPFSFLNGDSIYAGFCTRYLIEHYKSSRFRRQMKHALFSISHNDSIVRFGLDTAREIDHRDAKKCIRPCGHTKQYNDKDVHSRRAETSAYSNLVCHLRRGNFEDLNQDETKNEDIASKI